MSYDAVYIALGCGTQSSYLKECSERGLHNVPKADFCIFADTGDEPKAVYEYLEYLKALGDIPVHVVSAGHLSKDSLSMDNKRSCLPVFTPGMKVIYGDNLVPIEPDDDRIDELFERTELEVIGSEPDYDNPSLALRKCTYDYKIAPIEKKVRELLGYKKGERVKKRVRAMIGISYDEMLRMKPSGKAWIENTWPLVDAGITRQQCIDGMGSLGLKIPPRSACVYCPHHKNAEWRNLRDNDPEAWAKAVKFDKDFRAMHEHNGLKHPPYLHRSLKPLDEVDIDDTSDQEHFTWNGECEGMCGV